VRVLIESTPAALAERTGVGTYVWNLLRRLPVVDPSTEYVARYVHFRGAFRQRSRRLGDMPVTQRPVAYPWWLYRWSARFNVPPLGLFARCDVVFVPNFLPPPALGKRFVVTVHDLAFRLFPETAPQAAPWWQRSVHRAIRRASRIIVPSRSTRADLLALYDVEPDRVATVPLGIDRSVFAPAPAERVEEVRARYGIEGPYLLFLGRHPRKNLHGMLRAFAAVPEAVRPRLVVTGSRPYTRDGSDPDRSALDALPGRIRERVSLIGYVSTEDTVALLSGAVALAFPTFYEGFGFPALEAMACGTPVLTSNVSSLPDVVGDAAVLVDPRDDASIADGLVRLLEDHALRDRLRAAGLARVLDHDWDRTARATADVLHDAVDGR
jgi:glycosyltransferase involved in cell wall biosynthesis